MFMICSGTYMRRTLLRCQKRQDAINNLVVKSKSDDGKDNQNGNSNNGQNNGNTAGNGNGSGKGNGTSANGAVKTGDTAPIAGAFALMILAAGAVVTVLKRKRH